MVILFWIYAYIHNYLKHVRCLSNHTWHRGALWRRACILKRLLKCCTCSHIAPMRNISYNFTPGGDPVKYNMQFRHFCCLQENETWCTTGMGQDYKLCFPLFLTCVDVTSFSRCGGKYISLSRGSEEYPHATTAAVTYVSRGASSNSQCDRVEMSSGCSLIQFRGLCVLCCRGNKILFTRGGTDPIAYWYHFVW